MGLKALPAPPHISMTVGRRRSRLCFVCIFCTFCIMSFIDESSKYNLSKRKRRHPEAEVEQFSELSFT